MRISDWSSDVCSSDLESLKGSQIGYAVSHVLDLSAMAAPAVESTLTDVDRKSCIIGKTLCNFINCVVHATHITLEPYESRSEEHTSELQSLMRISYAVFCLKKKNTQQNT